MHNEKQILLAVDRMILNGLKQRITKYLRREREAHTVLRPITEVLPFVSLEAHDVLRIDRSVTTNLMLLNPCRGVPALGPAPLDRLVRDC